MGTRRAKIGIPILNRGDLLARLIATVDIPADVLIIANRIGPIDSSVARILDDLVRRPPSHISISVESPDGNLGVAGSWNRIIDYFDGDCFISNSDISFSTGALALALRRVHEQKEIVLQHLFAAACFYAAANFTQQLGWFDENFYPAYHEDQEMAIRSSVLNVRRGIVTGLEKGAVLHQGSQTLRSAETGQRQYVSASNRLHQKYLLEKWGSVPKKGSLVAENSFPFADSLLHPADWTLDLFMRRQIAALCLQLTGFECPITYYRWKGGLR
jgi:GT2 family glycosyltransferase